MYLRALTRSLVRRPQRFLVAVLAVAMGVGMAVALASVSLVLGDRLGRTVRHYGANLVLVPRGADLPLEIAGTDWSSVVEANVAALPESAMSVLATFRWRNNILGSAPQSDVAARVRRPGAGGASGASTDAVRAVLIGTWFDRALPAEGGATRHAGMKSIAPWWQVEGGWPDEQRLDGPAPALVGRVLARRLGVEPGDALALEVEGARVPLLATVSGILDAGGFEDDHVYVPLARLQQATGTAGQVDRVLVSALVLPGDAPPMPNPAEDLEAYERWTCRPYAFTVGLEIESAIAGVTARPVAQLVRGEGRLVDRLNLLMLLLTGAALTAAILGVMSTMVASVVDRTGEIALLRAVGASNADVARLFLGEALAVSAAGGLLGLALGWALAQLVGRGAFGTAVAVQPLLAPAALALAALVCLAGAWLPLRKAARVDPAVTLRAGA
jgi:putative ABC transport system permease protein